MCALRRPGGISENLAAFLVDTGWRVSVVNPARIKGFAQSELARNKTDRVNSAASSSQENNLMSPQLGRSLTSKTVTDADIDDVVRKKRPGVSAGVALTRDLRMSISEYRGMMNTLMCSSGTSAFRDERSRANTGPDAPAKLP